MPASSSSGTPVNRPGPSFFSNRDTSDVAPGRRRGHGSCSVALRRVVPLARPQEVVMWNKDEVQGKVDQVKGNIKKKVGELNDDEQLQDEGDADKASGQVQEAFGTGRRKVGETIKKIGEK